MVMKRYKYKLVAEICILKGLFFNVEIHFLALTFPEYTFLATRLKYTYQK